MHRKRSCGRFADWASATWCSTTSYEAADHVRLLDAGAFWADVTAAVEAAGRNDPEYRNHLKAAAEKLLQAREQIHSQTMHWLDFVQLDPKNLAAAWPESLDEWLAGLRRGIG